MSRLFVPPKVRAEIAEQERRERRAIVWGLFDFDDPVCKEWQPELQRLDPYLRLGRAKPMAYVPGYTVMPGFYHWLRDNPNAPPTVTPITGPDGEWREPDTAFLDQLRGNDLQNPEIYRALIAQRAEQEAMEEKRRQEHREQMNQEVLEHYIAANRTQISMNRDTAWSQNEAGKRGRK